MNNIDKIPEHNSIRILLINSDQELLLICADDPSTTSVDGTYNGKFWFVIGGEIEPGESIMDTAVRELYEETGLNRDDVEFGPMVWFGEFEIVLSGKLTRLKQQFIVAHTTRTSITIENLTETEKNVIKEARWFNLDQINKSKEVIYPVVLKDYLPAILKRNYPEKPFEIDLGKKPIMNE